MRHATSPLLILLILLGTACATPGGAAGDDPDQPVASTPIAPPTDDAATGFDPDFDVEQARQDARALLGMDEADLPADVRVGRRGDEQFALIENYVLGRSTVELDDLDGSGFRVVQVTVELPDGPDTLTLDAS
jgi:hypothetical protein